MANFVLVINQVTAEQLEKILGIQNRSSNTVKFVPQGNGQQGYLNSPSMSEVQTPDPKNTQHKLTLYNNVRIEWAEGAAAHAQQVFELFVKEEKKEEKAG